MVIAVALALLDFAPVFFLGLGLFFLAQLVDRLDPRCRRLALSGFVLVSLGAGARALANLALAVTGAEWPMLATTIYVFAGPGFTLMAGSLWRALSTSMGRTSKRDPWTMPLIVGWIFLLAAFYANSTVAPGAWKPTLLLLAFLGNLMTSAAAATLGWRRHLHVAALLFAFNIASAITLIALRNLRSQNLLLQSLEVLLSVASHAALAFASWRVAAEYQARVGPVSPVTK